MALSQRIETLRQRRTQLDHLLWDEEHRPLPDIVKVRHIKREKLFLKDQIVALAREEDSGAHRRKRAS